MTEEKQGYKNDAAHLESDMTLALKIGGKVKWYGDMMIWLAIISSSK